MRLAAYGWADASSGSIASAGDLLLRALVDRGVEVDFLANRYHVPCPDDLTSPLFQYLGVDPPYGYQRVPVSIQGLLNRGLRPFVEVAWRKRFLQTLKERGRGEYDALLSLGTLPPFRIPQCPTVAWLQGPPQTELEAVVALRPQIEATSGRRFWLTLVNYYRFKQFTSRDRLEGIDVGIVGSSWSVRAFERWPHSKPGLVAALPYPLNLSLFRPGEIPPDVDRPLLLHLGRLDPRKRLDLLLEAFREFHASEPDAQLLIVGNAGYAPHQLSLLDSVRDLPNVSYRPAMPRSEIIPLLQSASLVVQTSMNEDFGSAIAEALACGTPVVVGPTNGTGEYVSPSSSVFTTYSPGSVAEALQQVLQRRRADPLGVSAEARETAERTFDAQQIAGKLIDLIEHATEATAAQPRD